VAILVGALRIMLRREGRQEGVRNKKGGKETSNT